MAENIAKEQEEESPSGDMELQPLSVDDYQTLLRIFKINLPEGTLNSEVTERSTHPDLIKDLKAVVQDLRKAKLTVVHTPRLSCVKIKQVYDLKARAQITDILKIIFFKKCKTDSDDTLKKHWEKNVPKSGSMFRMSDTFNETPMSAPETPARPTGSRNLPFGSPTETPMSAPETPARPTGSKNPPFGRPTDNRQNAEDCFRFFLEQEGLDIEDVNIKREYKVDLGFISGRLDFLLENTNSAESSETSLSEKIIIECKGTKLSPVGDVFTSAHDEGQELEFNKSHQYYHQTQAYLHILKKELNPAPVRAVMVLKHIAEHTNPKFYCGEVSDDTQHIQELINFCQEEVLPRFLAVLNLIFRKVEESGGAGVMGGGGEAGVMEGGAGVMGGGAGVMEGGAGVMGGGAGVMEGGAGVMGGGAGVMGGGGEAGVMEGGAGVMEGEAGVMEGVMEEA